MEVRGDVVAEKREEGGDGKSFVAVAENAEIDVFLIVKSSEPCDEGIDGDHEEDADDTDIARNMVSPARK